MAILLNSKRIDQRSHLNRGIQKILITGKARKGDLKGQFYINIAVVLGFLLLIIWVVFLYPKTFIDIKLVLLLLFLPSLLLTVFIYKQVLSICGYEPYIKNNRRYNSLITTVTYLLITVPVGNFLLTCFLLINYSFAQNEIQIVKIQPYDIGHSNSSGTSKAYAHIDVEWDGIKKRLNIGNKSAESISGKTIRLKLSKGLMGYYIIRGYRFEDMR